MATIRLTGSTISYDANMSYDNEQCFYQNTDGTSYGRIWCTTADTNSHYFYIRGFNFDAIPQGSTINSFTIKIRGRGTSLATSSSYNPKIVNDTTTLTGTCQGVSSTTVITRSFTSVGPNFDTLRSYGNNFGIRITYRRSNRATTGYQYIYGAEILVDYTPPVESSTPFFIKDSGVWNKVSKVYRKVDGTWVIVDDYSTLDRRKKWIRKG